MVPYIVPFSFGHFLDFSFSFFSFFHLGSKNKKIPEIPIVEVGKKMPCNFALLRHTPTTML